MTTSTVVSQPRRNLGVKAGATAASALLLALLLLQAINLLAQAPKQRATTPVPAGQVQATTPAQSAAGREIGAEIQLAAVPPDENTVVARINAASITLDEFARTAEIDAIVATFLGQPVATDTQHQLDRLINGTLVAQHAAAANFALPATANQQALATWLAGVQQTENTLQRALAAKNVPFAEFTAHFAQLLLVDRFLSEAAAQARVDRHALLQQWQQRARISFGPAASQLNRAAVEVAAPVAAVVATTTAALPPTDQRPATTKIGPFTLWQEGAPAQTQPIIAQTVASITDPAPAGGPTTAHSYTISTSVMNRIVTPTVMTTPTTSALPDLPPIGLAPGNRAPTFTLTLLANGSADKLTTWHGQPIVLSFWTTWCPYCRKQTPVLVDAATAAQDEGIQFIGVNVSEPMAPVTAYVAEHGIPYPILLDSEGTVATQYNVRGYPTTYFIDAAGQIVAKHVGTLNESQLADYLIRLGPPANQ